MMGECAGGAGNLATDTAGGDSLAALGALAVAAALSTIGIVAAPESATPNAVEHRKSGGIGQGFENRGYIVHELIFR